MESEDSVRLRLEELHKDLGKKQRFEEAVSTIISLLQDRYPTASPSLRKSFYSVICRVATVLKTRFTAPGFWLSGLKLFEFSLSLLSEHSERQHLQACVAQAKEILHQIDNPSPSPESTSNGGYLFEGHLTVDPEPPQPQWLVQSNLLTAAAAALSNAESSQSPAENSNTSETVANILQALNGNFDDVIDGIINFETDSGTPKVPPASKEVVAKLPVITITEEVLAKLGKDVQCAICRENLAVDDKMQELPCKHTFHPPCLKPWLDEHNSCPICRYELPTDDHKYESWKEREKEAEEERKGAANAVRGGEFMYI
ncbi:E3 ubiquitin-protein ligase AIP2 [Benincasa hispida]|uniref:E3 ubiquitin-protein ligase AIP2 n=1 Tax=Benincasa hispida TaxID=102211 RepID=UPI001901DB2F|nr:E3 ubiquitin-protein ligase AIP2 [Benincasa hispida]